MQKNSSTPSDTGSVAFSIKWLGVPTKPGLESESSTRYAIDCTAAGISTVEASIKTSGGSTTASGGPWSCSAGAGSITGVPAGANLVIEILGRNSSNAIIYQGQKTGLTVIDGQRASAGTVVVAPIGSYTVSGSVSGLSGTLALQNNGSDDLTVTADGSFTFSSAVADGGSYTVTVLTQPSGQTCTVSSSSGTISGSFVTNVLLTCSSYVYVDDFEAGNLNNWTVGGRRTGSYTTDVVDRNGSKRAHVYHSGFTEVNLSKSFTYESDLTFSFEMEATSSGGSGSSSFYASASVHFNFLDSSGTALGAVTYKRSTSTAGLASSSTSRQFAITDNANNNYDLGVQYLLSAITIDKSLISDVQVSFNAYGSAYGSYVGEIWFDNFAVYNTSNNPVIAPAVLVPPAGVVATAGSSQTALTWDSVPGATSYNFYWSTTSGVNSSNGTQTSSATSPYTHTGLTNGTTYYYVVTAVNSFGESGVSSEASATPVLASYTVGGTVSGLSGTVVLQNNGGDDLTITADGSFTFATAIDDGLTYSVTVLTQPSGQTCTVGSGSGTISNDITNVTVTCAAATYTVGGTVSGLTGTVVLQNNGGDDLTITADGSFTFATAIADTSSYSVAVFSQPTGQTCTVGSGGGTISSANVTNVSVACTNNSYTVAGTVSGLSGTVVLQNNGGDDLTVTADGSVTFATAIVNGSSYDVTVLTQPLTKTCSISNGSGTISGANVTNVTVSCTDNTVGGTVSGLSGTVVLQNNGGDNLTLTTNSSFTFTTPLDNGASYSVTVLTQPSGQTCTVSSGSGTISGAIVTSVSVSCDNHPTVTFTSPADSAVDITVNASISITFSEVIDTSTITASTFTLSGGITGTFTFSGGNTIATLQPNTNLSYSTAYTVTLTSGIQDIAGNPFAGTSFTFTTVAETVSCTTTVPAGLVSGQTWTTSGSPYCVTGDIQVSLLTINPGVDVRVDGAYKIEVLSTITSVGTSANPILFSAKEPDAPMNQRWKGLKFENSPTGSQFTYTTIEYSDDGGVSLTDSNAPGFTNCTIRNNSKVGSGGGISTTNISTSGITGDLVLTNCTFSDNTATQHGGALHIIMDTGYKLNITGSTFNTNIANPSQAGNNYVGGAIYLEDGDATIKNSQFAGNITNSQCYGTFGCNSTARGGAIYINGTGTTTLENIEVRENQTYALNTSTWSFCGSTNSSHGGGVYVNSGTVTLTNSIISGNTTTISGCGASHAGGGLFVNSATVTVVNSTIARNLDATGVHFTSAGGTLNIINSIIYNNNSDGTQIGGTPTISYSDVQGGYTGTGNINSNPVFSGTGYTPSDLTISLGSPAIDTGNPDAAYDDVCLPPSLGTTTNDMGAHGGPLACDW